MNLFNVAEEIRTALGAISGLRRPPWGVESVPPPAAVVALPESIDYTQTYGRGTDRYPDMAVIVFVGRPNDRAAYKRLAAYVDGAGPKSIVATLEAYGLSPGWTACESVTVNGPTGAEIDVWKLAGVEQLAAIFHLDIVGKGTA